MFSLILQLLCAVFTYCLVDIVISFPYSQRTPFPGGVYPTAQKLNHFSIYAVPVDNGDPLLHIIEITISTKQ
jgi:hypothetical protein